jgi:cytidyltransferase-like protein
MKSFLELVEEQKPGENHHVMTFGRMNPPTTGHLKLIDKVHEIAKKHNATHSVVTSHSQDAKKNPLSAAQKVKHLKRYSPGSHIEASSKEHPTFLHHAAELHKKGVTHLHMVVGSDRVKEMKEKLHKYNGPEKHHLYNFKKIHVHSAGHRDPDAEGTSGMSGTKMREHAKNKDIHSFRQGVPSHVSDKHAHELMHDTRKGMGLHESVDRGLFKAVFVTGGPGSGKDIVIREAIAECKAVEMNSVQAFDYLMDKQKLSEKTSDFRREALRNRLPLIINGPADDHTRMITIREELQELGYNTSMIYVDITNEASKERNQKLTKMISESVRYDKWKLAQTNKEAYIQNFDTFIDFDNSASFEDVEQDITETYQKINNFFDDKDFNLVAYSWLENHGKLNALYKEDTNVKKTTSSIPKITKGAGTPAAGPGDITPDNRAGDTNADNVKWDAGKRRSTYTFRTYSEAKTPTLKVNPVPKETNFSKDNNKINSKKWNNVPTVNQRLRNLPTLGPEYDTRQQGTVYPMSGLGDVTYREEKNFKSFRNMVNEFADDADSGLGGVLGGASNKENMETLSDKTATSASTSLYKKNKKGAK